MKDKRIWKYELDTVGDQIVIMPAGAQILSCQIQDDRPCLWVMTEPGLEEKERLIEMISTGSSVRETLYVGRVFIDTIQLHGGSLVFHVFERVLKGE